MDLDFSAIVAYKNDVYHQMPMEYYSSEGEVLCNKLFEDSSHRFYSYDPSENEKHIRIKKYGDAVYPGDGTDLITLTDREMKALLNGDILEINGEYGLLIRYK